ncbi:unnamed protein product [Protopolystoma xenopodis]|uniref:Uncharacterized protein n=1 Tax=Protopolystoma xenopodis TaxID=117903 RepID=A0A3S5B0R8_9PLAT|nr:unnamed protein product [Protopolystoma xenopodis]
MDAPTLEVFLDKRHKYALTPVETGQLATRECSILPISTVLLESDFSGTTEPNTELLPTPSSAKYGSLNGHLFEPGPRSFGYAEEVKGENFLRKEETCSGLALEKHVCPPIHEQQSSEKYRLEESLHSSNLPVPIDNQLSNTMASQTQFSRVLLSPISPMASLPSLISTCPPVRLSSGCAKLETQEAGAEMSGFLDTSRPQARLGNAQVKRSIHPIIGGSDRSEDYLSKYADHDQLVRQEGLEAYSQLMPIIADINCFMEVPMPEKNVDASEDEQK